MKNYIDLLSDEELGYICQKIGGTVFRDYYKKRAKQFNKMKPGFRPEKLSNDELYAFSVNNKKSDLVSIIINWWVEKWLNEIDEYQKNQEMNGMSEESALVETLTHSVFSDRLDVYFTVTEKDLSVSGKDFLCVAVKTAGELYDARKQIESLSQNQSQNEMQAIYEEKLKEFQKTHESELQTAQESVSILQNEITQRQAEFAQLKAEYDVVEKELTAFRTLASYRVEAPSMEPMDGFSYMSLCSCYSDDKGQKRLFRFADVINYEFSETLLDSAPTYVNLFRKEGFVRNGYIGVWSWRVIPNKTDSQRDYIETAFHADIHPIEVYIVHGCQSVPEIIKKLKTGIEAELHTDRILFSVDNDTVCKGVFCNANALTVQSGIITVKSEVSKLPVFTFLIGDTLQYQGTLILKKTELNTVEDLVRVYDPMEIVRDRMISRISWSVAEQKGFLKNEYRQIRDFLTELSADDLYTDIAESCDCSTEEARAYVEEYLKHADAVMNGTTLENSIMAQIIRNDASLYQACMNEIRDDWETQNHDKTAAAQASLDAVKAEENQRKAEVSALNAEFSDWQEKLRVIQASYREQEQLAEDVEKRVSEKIEQARQQAAEFIADQAFIHPENRTVPVSVQGSSVPDDSPRFIPGAAYASEEPDIYDTYNSFLLTLQNELLEAGVSERQNIELSGILYAAFIERIPLLLIGPSGMDIAEALSVSLNCRYPDVLHCEDNFCSHAIAECRKSDADVIVIDNPFETKWRNSVMNLLSKREKFYIAVHPYAEDLVIEPKGLFNYCIPIFTDLLIDKLPTGNYFGGKASERFKHFEGTEATDFFGKILRKMGAGAITGWSIQKLSADMHRLLKIKETDADYQMLLYPLAYVFGELPLFADFMENDASKPSAQVIELLKERMGATE